MYLKLTDGTTTIDLLGGSPFTLEKAKWSPAVSYRQDDRLGGNPFVSVIERIPLYAKSGTSAAVLLAAVDQLAGLIDQAWRWHRGENVDPVLIRYSPTGTVTYLQDILIGPPLGEAGVLLPPTMHDDLYQALINDGITLQFVRRNGEWLGEEDIIAAGVYADVATIQTVTMTDSLDLHTPVAIKWHLLFCSGMNYAFLYGYILVCDSASKIRLGDLAGMSRTVITNGSFSNQTGTFSYAGATVVRFTATANGASSGILGSSPGGISIAIPDKRLGVVISVRVSTGSSWMIQPFGYGPGMTNKEFSPVFVDSSSSNPQFIMLGNCNSIDGFQAMNFVISSANATAGDYIEGDMVAFIGIDSPTSRVIEFGTVTGGSGIVDASLFISPMPLSSVRPYVGAIDYLDADKRPSTSWNGDPYLLSHGDEVTTVLLLRDSTNPSYWLAGCGGAFSQLAMTVTRRPGYLIPT